VRCFDDSSGGPLSLGEGRGSRRYLAAHAEWAGYLSNSVLTWTGCPTGAARDRGGLQEDGCEEARLEDSRACLRKTLVIFPSGGRKELNDGGFRRLNGALVLVETLVGRIFEMEDREKARLRWKKETTVKGPYDGSWLIGDRTNRRSH
jgi:hypothetical protein